MWALPLLVIIIPIGVLLLKIGAKQGWRWRIFGVVVGITIMPISFGISTAAYHAPISFVGMTMDILGMLSSIFHGAPGYQLGVWFGLFSGNEVTAHGIKHYYSLFLGAVVWAMLYGALGYFIDMKKGKI